jgi:hypothetical protein
MKSSPRGRLAQGTSILLAFLLAGCGSAAVSPSVTPEPIASATPTPTPTPSPTPSITPSPTASSAVDAAAGLAIASPYELVALDEITAAAINGAMDAALGDFNSVFAFGYRSVTKSGEPLTGSLVMVMSFPSGAVTSMPGFLDSVAGGMAGTGSGSIKSTTILDHPVDLITTDSLVYAAYLSEKDVVIVMTPALALSKAIVTALISASE